VEEEIDPALAGVLTLPFSFQPLVENAVQHGVQFSPKAGRLRLVVCRVGKWLEMSVSDDGQGVLSSEVEQIFFAERPRVHALALLRRRLQALFGRAFHLEIQTEVGQGTTARMRIPLQRQPVHGLVSERQTAAGDLADFLDVGIRHDTVRAHLKSIFTKLGVENRLSAALRALQLLRAGSSVRD
jgi:hypothetical protein